MPGWGCCCCWAAAAALLRRLLLGSQRHWCLQKTFSLDLLSAFFLFATATEGLSTAFPLEDERLEGHLRPFLGGVGALPDESESGSSPSVEEKLPESAERLLSLLLHSEETGDSEDGFRAHF